MLALEQEAPPSWCQEASQCPDPCFPSSCHLRTLRAQQQRPALQPLPAGPSLPPLLLSWLPPPADVLTVMNALMTQALALPVQQHSIPGLMNSFLLVPFHGEMIEQKKAPVPAWWLPLQPGAQPEPLAPPQRSYQQHRLMRAPSSQASSCHRRPSLEQAYHHVPLLHISDILLRTIML